MGSTNDPNRFTLPDNSTQDCLFNVGDAVAVGDLMFDAGSDKARPADKMTTLATEALDQAQFAQKFIGVSQQQILAAETNATKRIALRVMGVCEFKCPSQTFNKGDMVGIFSDGTALDPQQVDKVTHPALSLGVVVKFYGAATTRVRVAVFSRKTWDIAHSWAGSPMLFDGQAVATATADTDAAQTYTVASTLFHTMVPTAARTITLPTEAQSKGLAFVIWNNSGGAFALNLKKSDGTTAISGTAAIPQGKIGIALCDGVSWFGIVSA